MARMTTRPWCATLSGLAARDGFWRAASVVAGGTAVVQLISLLAAPLVTRLYTPAEFGGFALYLSILSLLLGVCALRYELAIPLAQDDAEAAQLLVLALLIVLAVSLLAAAATAFLAEPLAVWGALPALAPSLWLLPLALLGAGVHQVLSHWSIRRRAFAPLAHSRITQGLARTATQLTAGGLGAGTGGLVLGDLLGRAGSAIALAMLGRRDPPPLRPAPRLTDLARVAGRFRRFAALSSGSALLNMATTHLPALLLSLSFAAEIVGWFALAQQVFFLPVGLIAQAVTQVFAGEAPAAARQGRAELRRRFLEIARGLALIAAAPALVLALVAPPLFELVFGAAWAEAGGFARLMAPLLFFTLVVSPLGTVLNVLGRADLLLAWNAVRFAAAPATLLGVPALGGTAAAAIASYSAAMTVTYLALLAICLWQIRRAPAEPQQPDRRSRPRGSCQ
jgi:O-antigen/teichoic acid export membrane protein